MVLFQIECMKKLFAFTIIFSIILTFVSWGIVALAQSLITEGGTVRPLRNSVAEIFHAYIQYYFCFLLFVFGISGAVLGYIGVKKLNSLLIYLSSFLLGMCSGILSLRTLVNIYWPL